MTTADIRTPEQLRTALDTARDALTAEVHAHYDLTLANAKLRGVVREQVSLLLDAQHALANGRENVTVEYLDRAIVALHGAL